MPKLQIVIDAENQTGAALGQAEKDLKGVGAAAKDSGAEMTGANKKAGVSFTEIASAVSLAKQGYEMAQQAIEATVGPTVELAKQQRDLATASGTSAEEAGTMIQVADDLGVSYDTLKTASKKLNAEGIAPNIENIAKLSEEYQRQPDSVSKAQFAADKFGKAAGPEMQKMLALSRMELQGMAKDALASGMVLSNEAVAGARAYEIAQDNLQDATQALAMKVGQALIPTLTELANFTVEKLVPFMQRGVDTLALLVTWNERVATAYEQHSAEVTVTSTTYEEYAAEMQRSAAAQGLFISSQGNLVTSLSANRSGVSSLVTANYLLTDSQWEAHRVTAALGDARLEAIVDLQNERTATDADSASKQANKIAQDAVNDSLSILKFNMAGAVGNEMAAYGAKQAEITAKMDETRTALEKLELTQGLTTTVTQAATVSQDELALAQFKASDETFKLADLQAKLSQNTDPEKQHALEGAVLAATVAVGDANAKVDDYSGKLGNSMLVTIDHTQKIEELRAKYGDLTTELEINAAKHEDATKRILFGILAQRLAIDGTSPIEEKFLNDTALKWGLVDQATHDATEAILGGLDQVAKDGDWGRMHALMDLTATHAASATGPVKDLWNSMAAIPSNVSSTITITTVHRDVQEGQSVTGRAGGGGYEAGVPVWTGERGPELLFPSTDGYVMNNSDSKRFITALEAIAAQSQGRGGGGGTNITMHNQIANGLDIVELARRVARVIQQRG